MPLTVVANYSGEYMQDLIAVQKLINDFAKVKRSVYMPESDDYENDVHHSFSLALLAWQIHDKLNLDLDVAKILKYALVHDLVEVYAGDTHAFSTAAERKRKLLKEAESLKKLRQEFAELFPDLTDTMAAYEEGDHADDEAKFVWSVDKLQPMLQGQIDNRRCFYEQGITKQAVSDKQAINLESVYEPFREAFASLAREFINSYDDEMVEKSAKPHNNSASRK